MSLVALPTELLSLIIQATIPLGYEALMLSCRSIHEVGREFLPKHNRLGRKYKRFKYDNQVQCSLQLLHCISKDPIIAEYIETANFLEDAYPKELQGKGLEAWDAYLRDPSATESIMRIFNLAELPKCVRFHPKKWLESVANNRRPGELSIFATTVILSLLPNAKDLVLPKQWACFPPPIGNNAEDEQVVLWKALDAIAYEASIESDRSRALSKLTRIHPFHFINYDSPLPLMTLAPFLILPSLKHIRVSNCVANRAPPTGRPFNWRYPLNVSTLRKIELASCCVDGRELAKFLKYTPYLHSFILSYESKSYGCGSHLDGWKLVEALRSHCASTLVELSITIDRMDGNLKGGLRSFKEFIKLEHVELDVRFFFGPEVVGRLIDMFPQAYRNHAYDNGWNGTDVPSLMEVLPSTIKSGRFIAGSSREDILILKSLFAHVHDRVVENLPALEALTVSRACSRIGEQSVAWGQSSAAWKSVRETVNLAGYDFEEMEIVRASWLDDFYRAPMSE